MMRALSASHIVEAWGRGRPMATPRRPLVLLSAALPEATTGQLAELTVGERDEALLELRRATFGPTLTCRSECPGCQTTLTFDLAIDEILAEAGERAETRTVEVEEGSYRVRFRLPTAADVAAAAALGDVERGRQLLLESCVLEAHKRFGTADPANLPEAVIAAIARRMERMDPLCEVPVELGCTSCGESFSPLLDIGTFLWKEIAAMAERLMYDVHVLARYYGWTEEAVLAMGSARRKRYLDMASPST